MLKRAVILVIIAAVILAILFYSQRRGGPAKVSGFVEADEIRLGSRVGGRVAKVNATDGQAVKAGDLLVELEPFDLLHLKAQVQGQLAQRRAEYDKLAAGFRPEDVAQAKAKRDELEAKVQLLEHGPRKETIDAARGRLDQAQADAKYAESNLAKIKSSLARGAATAEELDKANQFYNSSIAAVAVRTAELAELLAGSRSEDIAVAKAQLAQAEEAWKLTVAGYRKEEITAAKAAMEAAEAGLKVIETQIAELVIKAPLDGVIEACDLQPGQIVSPNAPALTMLPAGNLYVRSYIPENRLDIKPGRPVAVTTDSFPGRKFAAEVTFVARQGEFTPSNIQTTEKRVEQVFRIKVSLKEGLDMLRPGMPVDVLAGRGERQVSEGSVIEVSHLTRRFGALKAVSDVSFSVDRGAIFGLLGPNGSGKSTIIRMMCGVLVPSAGQVTVLGQDVTANPEAVKRRVGYMSQKFSLYSDLSVRENLEFYGRIYGLDDRKLEQRSAAVMELTSMGDKASAACRHALGRLEAAAGSGLLADPPAGGDLPGRADRRHRPGGAARAVGPAVRAVRPGRDAAGYHALHGRG